MEFSKGAISRSSLDSLLENVVTQILVGIAGIAPNGAGMGEGWPYKWVRCTI